MKVRAMLVLITFFANAACSRFKDRVCLYDAKAEGLSSQRFLGDQIPASGLENFRSCGELYDRLEAESDLPYGEDVLWPGCATDVGEPVPFLREDTNDSGLNQTPGVGEADQMKIHGEFVILARNRSLSVLSRLERRHLYEVPLKGHHHQLMTEGGSVLVISEAVEEGLVGAKKTRTRLTRLEITSSGYRILAERALLGSSRVQRTSSGHLLLAGEIDFESLKTALAGGPGNTFDDVRCDAVMKTGFQGWSGSLSVIRSIDWTTLETKSGLGIGQHLKNVYVHADGLYALSTSSVGNTLFLKARLNEHGDFEGVATGYVWGHVRNTFSLFHNPDQDLLNLAFTDKYNHSYFSVFEQNGARLEQVGAELQLGRSESVRAVRYFDDKAFVVTFRETDPLFIIDLKEPRNPRLRGQMETPGFSVHLQPLTEGLILGVGYSTSGGGQGIHGLQVSLFDVSDDMSPKIIAQREFTGSLSYWEVADDHHAIGVASDRREVLLPMVQVGDGGQVQFTGALHLGIEGDIAVKSRYSHSEHMPTRCHSELSQRWRGWWGNPQSLDINRAHFAGGRILASRFAVTFSDDDEDVTVVLPNVDQECQSALDDQIRTPW